MLGLIIGILIIVVVGESLFWIIAKVCQDERLTLLLKLLVVLVCLGAIVARLHPGPRASFFALDAVSAAAK